MDEIKDQAEGVIEKDERDTCEFWKRWIKAAERAADSHWKQAKAAWAEYENSSADEIERNYPIYWSSCKTLEPAFYSKTPKLTTRRRFDIKDEAALTGCIILERLGEYLLDQFEFDDVMQAVVADYIHADKATPQLLYDHESGEGEDVPLELVGEEYVTSDGTPWTEEVFSAGGAFFGKTSVPTKQRIYLAACRYDEVLHSPEAKCESEIREKAYYFYMSKDEAKARFGEKAQDISWKNKKDSSRRDVDGNSDRTRAEAVGEYVEGWEIWSKPNKRVYWISEQYHNGFLDSVDDPYQLREFFPSPPFIIGSKPSRHLYPTPIYTQVSPLLEELHTSASKVSSLIHAIRRRAIVDPSLEDLVFALEDLQSGEFIVAKNFASIVEKGGVENLIFYLPVEELVNSINELTTLQEKFKQEFFEWFGVPDILRGATEPMESASAQQLKAESAHDRFKWAKKQVARIARDSIELMLDLALGVMDDATIAECCGYDFLSPEDQARFPEALAMLRNDKARSIRIEIESDSMSFVDEQLRAQQVNQTVQTVTQGLRQVADMIELSPEAAAVGLQALLLTLDTMPAGKEFHDEVKQTLEQLIEKAKQPKEDKPDLRRLKVEIEQQKLQLESQRDQMDMQAKMRDLDRKDYELQLKAGTETAKIQIDQSKAQLEQMVQQVMLQLEQQRVQIENFKAQMQARESEMEEIRLAREVDIEAHRASVEIAKTTEPESAQSPVINVINVKGQPELPPLPVIDL